MTTVVAFRPDLTMMADSRISHGDATFRSTKKIQRVGNFLVGLAGEYGPALNFLRQFALAARGLDGKTPPTMPTVTDDFEMIALSSSGLWLYSSGGEPLEIEEDYYAVGTGGIYARTALRVQEMCGMPHDIHMALNVACEFDPGSALPLVELALPKTAKPRRGAARVP
mgnify:CR=1 FL=1